MTSSKPDPRTHVHVALNWVHHSSRMLRETASIVDAGLAEKVYLAGKWEPSVPESTELDEKRSIVRLKPWTRHLPKHSVFGILVQIEMTVRLLLFCKKHNPAVIQCHWIEALPVGYLYRRLINKEAKLVYDAHELETEKYGVYNTFKKPLYKLLERLTIRSADLVFVVSPSIADWYQREYRLENLSIIRNIPSRHGSEPQHDPVSFRNIYNIPGEEIVFIYQGRLSPGRGLDMLLRAFVSLPRRFHIVFMGYGPLESMIRKFSRSHENIHYHPAVSPSEVISFAQAADVGISLPENSCLNHYYCLPNKLFEYILAGVPVVASDFPDMAGVIGQYECGWTVTPTIAELRQLVIEMTPEDLSAKKRQAIVASNTLDWRFEAQTLVQAYRRFLNDPPVSGTASPNDRQDSGNRV